MRLRIHRRMLASVMLRENIRVAQPKVAREIDDLHLCGQLRRHFHRLTVRQSEKSAVDIAQTFNVFGRFDKVQIN